MCIVFLDYQPDGSRPYLLILANNRDEFYQRPTSSLGYWTDNPDILAGRDLEPGPFGGSWLGINKKGRFSVLTNYRKHVNAPLVGDKSRGLAVSAYLQGTGTSPQDYCDRIVAESHRYEKFNLLVGDFSINGFPQLSYCNNHTDSVESLSQGVYTLSNEALCSPWAKEVEGRKKFESIISKADQLSKESLTDLLIDDLLTDPTCYHPDVNVRNTGHSEEWMKCVNRVFVTTPPENGYGTRSNSVILIDKERKVTFTERTLSYPVDYANPRWDKTTYSFAIED